jgi:hypothetical protein
VWWPGGCVPLPDLLILSGNAYDFLLLLRLHDLHLFLHIPGVHIFRGACRSSIRIRTKGAVRTPEIFSGYTISRRFCAKIFRAMNPPQQYLDKPILHIHNQPLGKKKRSAAGSGPVC